MHSRNDVKSRRGGGLRARLLGERRGSYEARMCAIRESLGSDEDPKTLCAALFFLFEGERKVLSTTHDAAKNSSLLLFLVEDNVICGCG